MNQLIGLIQQAIEEELVPNLEKLSEEEAEKLIDDVIHSTLAAVEERTKASIVEQAASELARAVARDSLFEASIAEKWGKSFDQMEVLWQVCWECAEIINTEYRNTAAVNTDYRFDALTRIHARALLVVREIICLLKGGYPDGALARWRTLHEHSVQAVFIGRQDQRTAMRFLASSAFMARNGARQYNRYADRANMKPYTEAEIAAFERRCGELAAQTGELAVNGDYDWASEALNNQRPKLSHLEEATGLDHWRPRYRWASLHTHGSHRDPRSMLGTAGMQSEVFLVGASDRGFSDPLQMAALSLQNCTIPILNLAQTLDAIVWIRVIEHLTRQVIEAAVLIEPQVPDDVVFEG